MEPVGSEIFIQKISPFVSWSFFYCGKYSWEDNIKIGQTSQVLLFSAALTILKRIKWFFFNWWKVVFDSMILMLFCIHFSITVLHTCLVFFKMSSSILLALAAGPKTVWAIYRSIIIICVRYQTVSPATYQCRVEINPWCQGHTLPSEGFPKPEQHHCS